MMHMSAIMGRPRQSRKPAPPRITNWAVSYEGGEHWANFTLANTGDEKIHELSVLVATLEPVRSVSTKGHVMNVVASGNKAEALEVKEAVEHMLAIL